MLQVLRERMPKDAKVLVLGAGGGLEILTMATAEPGWTFCGVDPSAEMLAAARLTLGEAAARVDWIEGLIFDAPQGPFDGGTCMLTLHFVPDDGAKLETLKAMRSRLKPGAPFVIAHIAIDKAAPDADMQFERYAKYSEDSGTDPEMVERARTSVKGMLHSVGPARDEALLKEAGFTGVELIFAGLVWRGWAAYA
jgi:tRNA (cmo5U34)-methyltransferase